MDEFTRLKYRNVRFGEQKNLIYKGDPNEKNVIFDSCFAIIR